MLRAIDPDVLRRAGLAAIGLFWLIAVGWITGPIWPDVVQPPGTVVVVHWANGHLSGDDVLLPAFTERFNAAGHRTAAGNLIRVKQYLVNSGNIERELVSRVQRRGPIRRDLPDPTLVTPVAEHWLYAINDVLNGPVVETVDARSLASTWIGIATFKEMAECLGWPNRDLGYEDIIALSADPAGWGSRQCGRAEWGRQPIVTYTDPSSSSTGRSVLFTLYSIAAGKLPEQLTADDVVDSRVISYLSRFQAQVAHYVPDSLLLNCEIFGGPAYGHFFPIAEDNLVKLYKGKIVQTDPALERLFPCGRATGSPIKDDMVMIYPREGATSHTNPAAGVRADWVTPEQREAAEVWIAFLRQDAQQRVLLDQGFRPVTGLSAGCPICPAFGLQTAGPKVRIDPNRIPPAVGEQTVAAWGDVKNTGVVVFVVDNSLSMAGAKLQSARAGVVKAIDEMYDRNLVGLVTFSSAVHDRVAPAPVSQNRFQMTEGLRRMQPGSGSALFGAIAEAVDMAARAPAPERAIRGVVVLAGGPATSGAYLSDVVRMASPAGKDVSLCRGFEREAQCVDENGETVDRAQVRGVRLTAEGAETIKVYFIGIGMSQTDLDVGRILADATRSNFVGTTADDLATVVGVFKGYF
jgi:Ca-activated chloride channel homolog